MNEMERMWEEVIMALFKVLFQHLPEVLWVNHNEPQDLPQTERV
jgi:hypothetical protein